MADHNTNTEADAAAYERRHSAEPGYTPDAYDSAEYEQLAFDYSSDPEWIQAVVEEGPPDPEGPDEQAYDREYSG